MELQERSAAATPPGRPGAGTDSGAATSAGRGARITTLLVPEVIFGVGALREAGPVARRMGGRRPLLVSDPGVMAAGWVERALPSLADAGLCCHVWHDLTPNPKDVEVGAAFEAYTAAGCDVLLAIGGGSCIDAAKGIAILSGNGGRILDYAGIDRVPGPIPPMVMIPTTGGSGADVTRFCVITDTARRIKCTIAGGALVPNASVIDPTLHATMPSDLTAHTGLDALSHAIESHVSKAANFLSRTHALGAIRGVMAHLSAALDDPADLAAREGMARAALQAGLAFSSALLGATHAISHQIGGRLDLPHGLLNAILLPHVMRFNAEADPAPYTAVADALGVCTRALDAAEAAEAAIESVVDLARQAGIPTRLGAVGVRPEDIPVFAHTALLDAYITTNPRPVTEQDVERICRAAY